MNQVADFRLVGRLSSEQRGVFSKSDLQTALGERHPAAFVRRLDALEKQGVLRRFVRGWYVAESFDLPTLSQRIAPASSVSFGHVLARELLVGTAPVRQVMGTKIGRTRTYRGLGCEVVHLGIAAHLDFGHRTIDGVRYSDPEKAVLDVLYFHLRGQKYAFDLYSDVRFDRVDTARILSYLTRYRNPKFVVFAKSVLGIT